MSTPTFLALDIGVSALQSSQMGLQVTGNNIANAQTPGYARETVNQSEAPDFTTYTSHLTYIGTGVLSKNPQRIADSSVDNQNRYNISKQSYWNQMNTELSNLQQIYNEPSGGAVSSAITSFFSAWNQLSQTPSDSGVRAAVLQSAQNLVAAFQQVSNALQSNASRYQDEEGTALKEVNTIAGNIANLNSQIQQAQTSGASANALLDQRSALLDKLSQYVQIQVTGNNNVDNVSAVTSSGSGIQLVSGTNATALTSSDVATLSPQSGTLVAYSDLSNVVSGSSGLLSQLNSLESSIESDVNNQLQSVNPQAGMFDTSTGEVSSSLTPSRIVAGASGASDGSTALAISDLLTNNGYLQNYSSTLTALGAQGSSAQANYTTFNALQTQSKNMKTSVSGVDVNQEMSNMVEYQQIYTAASKYISVFNEMLTSLIQNV